MLAQPTIGINTVDPLPAGPRETNRSQGGFGHRLLLLDRSAATHQVVPPGEGGNLARVRPCRPKIFVAGKGPQLFQGVQFQDPGNPKDCFLRDPVNGELLEDADPGKPGLLGKDRHPDSGRDRVKPMLYVGLGQRHGFSHPAASTFNLAATGRGASTKCSCLPRGNLSFSRTAASMSMSIQAAWLCP